MCKATYCEHISTALRVKRLMRSKLLIRTKYCFAHKATYWVGMSMSLRVKRLMRSKQSDLYVQGMAFARKVTYASRSFLTHFDVAMTVLRIPMLLQVVMTANIL